ncbi:MAG TPA: zf-HC2 domain-containing protein [Terracidiphilus sp.]|jgi:tetratricopeptide (TPR) repeat protein
MTDCIGAPAREWLERYVDGTLPDEEAQKFESHYFDCPRCLAELEELQAVQKQLREHPISTAPRARVFTWPMMVSFGAVAAALLIGLITLQMVRSPQPVPNAAANHPAVTAPAPSAPQEVQVAQLADLAPPAYHAAILRDGTEDTAFQRGMKLYAAGDCTRAMKTLAQVPSQNSQKVAALFYSGVCKMNARDFNAAEKLLHRVASAQDAPQQESAWYYLAQIALAQSNISDARQDLNRVVSLRGDMEAQARKELSEFASQPGSK